MAKIIPGEIPTRDLHQYLVGSIAPRPIAFVSTKDENGVDNLAPYSFFNTFSSNPPILVFSSNRRVVDNTTKDTLHNVQQSGECVINMVNYDIVRQMAVTSVQFDQGVNEFEMAGLTPIPSDHVKAMRVKESPVNYECKVKEIITLGEHGGAGHLVICEVICIHIDDSVVDDGRINPHKIDLMGRMGRAYYVRASGPAVHTIVQPVTKLVIGYDALPETAKTSQLLTGNDIGLLAGNYQQPSSEDLEKIRNEIGNNLEKDDLIKKAKSALEDDDRYRALCLVTLADRL